MTKLICIFFHRYLMPVFILVVAVLTFSYLIMANITNRKLKMDNRKISFLRQFAGFENNYELHKRDVKNFIQSSQFAMNTQDKKFRVILIWCPLFEDWNILQIGKNSFKNSGCSETRCEITSDRKRLLESDAVLFHVRTLSMLDIPRNRTQRQKWVFLTLEAPPYSKFQGFDFMVAMFNWTMTYRKDSDIFIPYGRIISNAKGFNLTDFHMKWKNKTKMAAWMVSHCATDGNRESYINKLKTYIDVDTFGGCGLGTCPFNKTNLCIENFSKQYHFFLAFENAICQDYITEKLFRTLQYDMIPVVFGGGNYTAIAPPNSYIDALSFQSQQHLASHLLQVASNFTLFSEYFKWRFESYADDNPDPCGLCQKLHSEDFKKHSAYFDINEWWVKKSHCKKWKDKKYTD